MSASTPGSRSLQDKLLQAIERLTRRQPKAVLVVGFALTVLALPLIYGLRISTSHSELLPSEHPVQARYLRFLDEFGAIDNMVVILEGNSEDLQAHADQFAREIRAETPFVRSVFYKLDLDLLAEHAPMYVPTEALKWSLELLKENPQLSQSMRDVRDLSSLLSLARSAFGREIQGLELDAIASARAVDAAAVFFGEWARWLDAAGGRAFDLERLAGDMGVEFPAIYQSGGYLMSHDMHMLFFFVQPVSSSDDAGYLKRFQESLHQACQRVFNAEPELAHQIKVAFTGLPAHVLTEVETIFADVSRAGLVSVLLVVMVLWLGFRSPKKIVLALLPLGCGMVLTLAIVRLTTGHLNLISSAFLAVLFGIGIDFAIYLIRRVEEELGRDLDQNRAVKLAVTHAGRGILTGGLTTGLAFFAVTFSEFIGFAELGLTAGTGILVVLVSTFLLLPALLHCTALSPQAVSTQARLVRWQAGRRMRTLLVVLSGSLFLFGVWSIRTIRFDFNALNLLPQDAESTVYQKRMEHESDFQMSFAVVTAESREALQLLEPSIAALPTVSRVDSLAQLIPADQEEKCGIVDEIRPFFSPADEPRENGMQPELKLSEQLELLIEEIENIQDIAFSGGQKNLLLKLETLRVNVDRVKDALSDASNDASVSGSIAFESELFRGYQAFWRRFESWLTAGPVEESMLDPNLIARFKSSAGNYVCYVFPRDSIWDLPFLDQFVHQLETLSDDVTGYPCTHRVNARLAVHGLAESLVYALLMIVVLLFADFRRVKPVGLALIPLFVGMAWVQGLMVLLQKDYNYASMAGLPLLLGLGVVYGVHIVHRYQEAPHCSAFLAVVTAGRGGVFAALTTISGLFSIVFARHKGVSDFGIVLMMGIVSCLVAATIVLPTLIDLIYLKRNEEPNIDKVDP